MDGILRISEAANLGLHAMVCLLGADRGRPLSVVKIAKLLNVSKDHLGKVLQRLSRAKLVVSRRGPRGGFALPEGSGDTNLLEILEVIDGPLTNTTCLLDDPICGGNGYCIFRGLMESLHEQVQKYLSSTSLNDVAEISPFAQQFAPPEKKIAPPERKIAPERERQLAAP